MAIAIHRSFLSQSSVCPIRIDDPAAKGHCKAIKISPPGSDTLIVWGVYVPHDPQERKQVYDMLRIEVPKAEAEESSHGKRCFSIMAGDWNAALLPGDKTALNTTDKAHQNLMAELCMLPTEQNLQH